MDIWIISRFLTIVNKATRNIHMHKYSYSGFCFHFSLGKCLEEKLLSGHAFIAPVTNYYKQWLKQYRFIIL